MRKDYENIRRSIIELADELAKRGGCYRGDNYRPERDDKTDADRAITALRKELRLSRDELNRATTI